MSDADILRDLELAATEPDVGGLVAEYSSDGAPLGRVYERVNESAASWRVLGTDVHLTWIQVHAGVPTWADLRTARRHTLKPPAAVVPAPTLPPEQEQGQEVAVDRIGFRWKHSAVDGRWHEITNQLGPLTGRQLEKRRGPVTLQILQHQDH